MTWMLCDPSERSSCPSPRTSRHSETSHWDDGSGLRELPAVLSSQREDVHAFAGGLRVEAFTTVPSAHSEDRDWLRDVP
jgi:hypothetical protein